MELRNRSLRYSFVGLPFSSRTGRLSFSGWCGLLCHSSWTVPSLVCVICLLPCLGAIVTLIVLATLKPLDRTSPEPISVMQQLIRHPLIFAIPLLVASIFVWKYQNPSSGGYRIRAYNSEAETDARDLVDMVKDYETSYEQYPSSFHPREGRVELFPPPGMDVSDISMKKKLRKSVWVAL